MSFSELVRLLEQNGFKLLRPKGSIRYYANQAMTSLFEWIIMEPKKCRLARVGLS